MQARSFMHVTACSWSLHSENYLIELQKKNSKYTSEYLGALIMAKSSSRNNGQNCSWKLPKSKGKGVPSSIPMYCVWFDFHSSARPLMSEAMGQSSEIGASNWLTSPPIEEFGFSLHKSAFVLWHQSRRPYPLPVASLRNTPSMLRKGSSFLDYFGTKVWVGAILYHVLCVVWLS